MEPAVAKVFSERTLSGACHAFGVDPASLRILGDHENYVYGGRRKGERRVLRISHPSHRSARQIAAEIHWVNYLRDNGLQVCGALASDHGRLVETVGEAEGTFFVACFEFAPGRLATDRDWGPRLFEEWGRFLGTTHRLASRYVEPTGGGRRHAWDEDPYVARALENIPVDQKAVRAESRRIRKEMETLPRDRGSFGLCHTDLYQANFHVDEEGSLHVFDTDDCAYHWFVEDISSALYYGCRGPGAQRALGTTADRRAFVREFLPAFWSGYREEYDLDAEWLERIPLFLQNRTNSIYSMLHVKYDFGALTCDQEDRLHSLRTRLERRLPWVETDSQRRDSGLEDIDYRAVAEAG